jgi:hypothetical protein
MTGSGPLYDQLHEVFDADYAARCTAFSSRCRVGWKRRDAGEPAR